MNERLIISAVDKAVLDRADELLDQMGEDAQDLGQDTVARVSRQAAESVRRVTSRLERLSVDDGPSSGYSVRGS